MFTEFHWWHVYAPLLVLLFCWMFSGRKDRPKIFDKTCVIVDTFCRKPSLSTEQWRWYFQIALWIVYAIVFWALGVALIFVVIGEGIEFLGDMFYDRYKARKVVPNPPSAPAAPSIPSPAP